MYVTNELFIFLQFVLIGIIISFVFDFFRAYRKRHKLSEKMVAFQDIIYFIIATIIVIIGIINILDSNIRLYTFIAIISGCGIYISLLSKCCLKAYYKIFDFWTFFLGFVVIPLRVHRRYIIYFYKFFEKIIKKCCKMFFYVISFSGKPIKWVKKCLKIRQKTNEKRGI